MPLARAVKLCPDIHIPVSVVGGIDIEMAENIISEGSADMVAIARGLLADPDMMKKCYRGEPETGSVCAAGAAREFRHYIQCAVNPALGRTERYARVYKADVKRKLS